MISCLKTDPGNPDFRQLVLMLDEELKIIDGEDHLYYAELNKMDGVKHAIVAYHNGEPSGCGAIREYSNDSMEIKRMYTIPEKRGIGIASRILRNLEDLARDLNYKKCILETTRKQPAAIALYKKHNFTVIPNYGHYKDSENSICFEKVLVQ